MDSLLEDVKRDRAIRKSIQEDVEGTEDDTVNRSFGSARHSRRSIGRSENSFDKGKTGSDSKGLLQDNVKSLLKNKGSSFKSSVSSFITEELQENPYIENDNEDNDNAYEIDYSMLTKLPKSVILEAIQYAKRKRREEQESELEKEAYIPLKCIPPWAKTYGKERLDVCTSVGTQYEIPSYLRLAEEQEKAMGGESIEDEGEEGYFIDWDEDSKYKLHSGEKIKGKFRDEIGGSKSEIGDIIEVDKHSEFGSEKSVSSGKSAVSAKTDVGLQASPQMYNLATQTGSDSLMDTREVLKKTSAILREEHLARKPSELEVGEEADIMEMDSRTLIGSISSLSPQERTEYLSRLSAEEKDFLGRKISLEEGIEEEDWMLDLLKGSGEYLQREEVKIEFTEEEAEVAEEGEVEIECELGELEVASYGEEQEIRKKIKIKEPGKQTQYLKEHLGHILPKILADIAWKRPPDPVHYLAHRLYCERRQIDARKQIECVKKTLQQRQMLESGDDEHKIKTFGYFERVPDVPKVELDPFLNIDEDELEEEERREEEEESDKLEE